MYFSHMWRILQEDALPGKVGLPCKVRPGTEQTETLNLSLFDEKNKHK
jgi:hypothetical protein